MKSRDRVLKLLQIAGPCGLTSADVGNVCFIHGKTLSVLMKRLVEENAVWVHEATYYSHADYKNAPESPRGQEERAGCEGLVPPPSPPLKDTRRNTLRNTPATSSPVGAKHISG